MNSAPLLAIHGLCKAYAGPVLENVSIELQPGEVHALVGENGAGKSTLSKIIAGLVAPDAGRMTLRGQPYSPRNKKDAEHHGVRMVMQELNLIGNLTVAESVLLEKLPHRLGWIDYPTLNARARQILDRVRLTYLILP